MSFNLLLSTARDYEIHAESEIWFHLMMLGDESPIISKLGIPGLLSIKTHINARKIIQHLQDIIKTDSKYIQFIQKLYPIDEVVASDLEIIKITALKLIQEHPLCKPSSSFRITIRKRNTPLKTDDIIQTITSDLHYKVDLKQYDWNLQIEIIGDKTGIAIITDNEIFRPLSESNTFTVPYKNDTDE